jgi:RNA polymerase sigma-70 factor (ECF subfamily)
MRASLVDRFPNLLKAMLPRLWVFSLRLCGDGPDAEELLLRACEHGLARTHELREESEMLGWMFCIIHADWTNESLKRQKQGKSIGWDCKQSKAGWEVRSPKGDAMRHAVETGVVSLPESQRIVMLLVAIEGLSYTRTARILDLPVSAVMCRLSRARQSIGALLNDREPVDV